MNIVITMAGLGSRFKAVGYTLPKYMIEAHGKTLFEWSMLSLEGFKQKATKYIFIVRKEDNSKAFIQEKCNSIGINSILIIEIDEMTDGQATTAMLAAQEWDREKELLIYNIDTYVESGEMCWEDMKGDGFIPCFEAKGSHWSFVKLDDDGKCIEVREKKRISNNCTLGAYYFRSCELYENLYNEYYDMNNNNENSEKYVAPLYNYLIEKGGEVFISNIEPDRVHVLGTPDELQVFLSKNVI